jgi:hypothetical protein
LEELSLKQETVKIMSQRSEVLGAYTQLRDEQEALVDDFRRLKLTEANVVGAHHRAVADAETLRERMILDQRAAMLTEKRKQVDAQRELVRMEQTALADIGGTLALQTESGQRLAAEKAEAKRRELAIERLQQVQCLSDDPLPSRLLAIARASVLATAVSCCSPSIIRAGGGNPSGYSRLRNSNELDIGPDVPHASIVAPTTQRVLCHRRRERISVVGAQADGSDRQATTKYWQCHRAQGSTTERHAGQSLCCGIVGVRKSGSSCATSPSRHCACRPPSTRIRSPATTAAVRHPATVCRDRDGAPPESINVRLPPAAF